MTISRPTSSIFDILFSITNNHKETNCARSYETKVSLQDNVFLDATS